MIPPPKSHFFNLPRELRDEIYGGLFGIGPFNPVIITLNDDGTNKQLYREARDYLFTNRPFVLKNTSHDQEPQSIDIALKFLKHIGRTRGLLDSLSIEDLHLPSLPSSALDVHLFRQQQQRLYRVLTLLQYCSSLTKLELCLDFFHGLVELHEKEVSEEKEIHKRAMYRSHFAPLRSLNFHVNAKELTLWVRWSKHPVEVASRYGSDMVLRRELEEYVAARLREGLVVKEVCVLED